MLKKELVNDIYGQYEVMFPGDEDSGTHSLKANVILPGIDLLVWPWRECFILLFGVSPKI